MLTNITSTLGSNLGGFLWLQLCPIEWLMNDVKPDGFTGTIRQPLSLLPGKALLKIQCQTDTIDLKEKPKSSASGDYHEVSITGTINLDEADKSLVLDEMRYHQLLVLCPDKNGRVKLYGNKLYGMKLSSELEVEKETDGKSSYDITLSFEQEPKGFFYEP